jgi:hypothetical protein
MAAIACFIVGGHMPWDLSLWHQKPTMTESKRLLAKLRRCEYDLSELPECMAKVIRKGLACKSRRYPNLQSFCLDLDYAMLNMLKELVDSRSSSVEDADSITEEAKTVMGHNDNEDIETAKNDSTATTLTVSLKTSPVMGNVATAVEGAAVEATLTTQPAFEPDIAKIDEITGNTIAAVATTD